MTKNLLMRLSFVLAAMASPLIAMSPAQAAMMGMIRPSLVGGINDMLSPSSGGLGYTGGLDIGFGLGMAVDLTVGGEYLSRAFTGFSNLNYVHIPGILFFHLAPMFSVGAGGFYDVALTSGAPTNYGVTGALRIHLGMTPFFVEGRYNYGLDTTDAGSNTGEIQALLGFHF